LLPTFQETTVRSKESVAGMGPLLQATTPTSMPEKEIVVPLKLTGCEDPQWLEDATHESAEEQVIFMGRVSGGQVQPEPVQESTCRLNV
jgi:hypothetical protein